MAIIREARLELVSGEGLLRLRVVPGARVEKIAIENGALKIWTRTAPEDGKANAAVITHLAKALGCSRKQIELVSGATARDKVARVVMD
ncbi:MAG: DUF167 domain-containing protein [Sphingomonadales bacterium]|nr:DUF167 domain-containing protein [Sphingomonadales bacterium]